MMKNNFLMIAILATLSACASNLDTSATQPMPVEIHKADAKVRTTIDPQPELNQNINNINRHAGTMNSIPKK